MCLLKWELAGTWSFHIDILVDNIVILNVLHVIIQMCDYYIAYILFRTLRLLFQINAVLKNIKITDPRLFNDSVKVFTVHSLVCIKSKWFFCYMTTEDVWRFKQIPVMVWTRSLVRFKSVIKWISLFTLTWVGAERCAMCVGCWTSDMLGYTGDLDDS